MLGSPLSGFALPTDAARLRREPPSEVAAEGLRSNATSATVSEGPSRSRDAETLYFERAAIGGGPGDVHVTTRSKGRVR
jgi:hypothetical protein